MRGVKVREEVVRDLRTKLGITQEELALRAGLDVKTIHHVERGQRRFDFRTVLAIAAALECRFDSLVSSSESSSDQRALHLNLVWRFHNAWIEGDIEALLSLHTEDSVLELPGTDGMPGCGDRIEGRDALRRQMSEALQVYRLRLVNDGYVAHAVDQLVFVRMTATVEHVPTGKSFTGRFFNEFEFRDGLIARRLNIADWGTLRAIVD